MRTQTEQAFSDPYIDGSSPYSGLYELTRVYKIPEIYFFEMLDGFKMDVDQFKVISQSDLMTYCYHVAGVVGLMMSSILEVKNSESLIQADHLGRAMQLTNIARDLFEDFNLGRIYLPLTWINEASLDPKDLMNQKDQDVLFTLAQRLLLLADNYYESGRRGIIQLPFRAAWSISIASFLYQGIGWKIRKLGPKALYLRTVLNPLEKLMMAFLGTVYFFRKIIERTLFSLRERFN